MNFLAGLVGRTPARPARRADTLPFPITVSLARLALPLATLRTLAPGDALFPPLTPADWRQGRCELWTGGRRLGHAVRAQRTVKIISMKNSIEPQTAPAAGPLPVDDLPVSLTFDLGQLELSVAQLRTLGEGYTFELPGEPDRLVIIRANGREIGCGELVEIGEKIGVRLVGWSLA